MKNTNSTAVGLFIVGGVLAAIAAAFFFSSGSFFSREHSFVLHFDESVNGLDVGAPVKLRGVKVGNVRSVTAQFDGERRCVRMPVTISLEESCFRKDRRKKHTTGKHGDFRRMPVIVGMVGTLQMESLITGKLFVDLNYEPTAANTYLQLDEDGIPELPTKPSNLQSVGDQLMQMAENLSRIDYSGIAESTHRLILGLADVHWRELLDAFSGAAHSIADLLNDGQTRSSLANLDRALEGIAQVIGAASGELPQLLGDARLACGLLGEVFTKIRGELDGNPSLARDLAAFLSRVGDAARSLGNFFDFLERNPNALLGGKFVEGIE
jgi:paraquat-inducible protein B